MNRRRLVYPSMLRMTIVVFGLVVALMESAASPAAVSELQDAWAQAMYVGSAEAREESLDKLATQAREEVSRQPQDAPLLIWKGIILSTLAGERGGLGGLALAKEARRSLEQALEIDASALSGSAYTSLGSLYFKVPGWPIGFGDHKKAREYLAKALEVNPRGIDPNYFMGDFLIEEGEHKKARHYLETALAAPDRPGRSVADAGRREEIRAKLAALDAGH